MASLNELAYDLLNKLEGGRSTHNSYISLEQIKFNIDYYRSLLLHRDLEQKSINREYFEQRLDITLDIVAESDLEDIKFFVRSTEKIPDVLRSNYRYLLNVYNKTTHKVFPVNNYHRMKYTQYNQYTKSDPRAYLLDGYIYIHQKLLADQLEQLVDNTAADDLTLSTFNPDVVIRGIFDNPRDVYKFNGTDPEEIDNMPYPISGDMIQRISQSIINGNLELILRTPNDTEHDTLPDRQTGDN